MFYQGQSPGSIKAESPSPSVITTAANGQSADIATGQATGQGQVQGEGQPPGTPGMAPSSKVCNEQPWDPYLVNVLNFQTQFSFCSQMKC